MTRAGERATLGAMVTTMARAMSPWREALKARGIDPDALPDVPVPDSHTEAPEDAAARRRLQAANRAARWTSRLPVMYAQADLDDLTGDQHADTLRRWLDDAEARHLVLAGSVGTGKTHAAYAIGHAAVARGLWVEAWTLADLLDALRPGGDETARDAARDAQVLILDDLSATKVSDWAVEQFTALLDHRLRMGHRTVVTTNLDYMTMEDVWGARAMDRVRYGLVACAFTGQSRRRAAW